MYACSGTDNFDEGLGTVYERFMLNGYFERLMDSYVIRNCLEVPIYGMTGLTGINSVHLAKKGCNLMLVDTKKDNLLEAERLWESIPVKGRYNTLLHEDLSKLPFTNNSFDLVWNFAALWHVKNAGLLLNEMARVSSNLVLIFVPNKKQPGYPLRKYVLDRRFFRQIDESWIDLHRITSHLKVQGMKLIEEGFIDIPLWPDTAIPIKKVLKKNVDGKKSDKGISKGFWRWDIMSYYRGNNPQLKDRIERLSFLEKVSIPKPLKVLWAHHLYGLYSKNCQ
jgi:SAM-dependent methyltransferase